MVVAERGTEGGRWHAHLLIRNGYRLPYRAIYDSWSTFLNNRGYDSPTGGHRWHAGDEHGKHKRGFRSAKLAAIYATKYLTKSMKADAGAKGERRYRLRGCGELRPFRMVANSLAALRDLLHVDFVPGDGECVRIGGDGKPFRAFWFDTWQESAETGVVGIYIPWHFDGCEVRSSGDERFGGSWLSQVWRKGCSRPCLAL